MSQRFASHPVFLETGKQGRLTSDSQDCSVPSLSGIDQTTQERPYEHTHMDVSQESKEHLIKTPHSSHPL